MERQTLTQQLIEEVKSLPPPQLRELRLYVYFLKARRFVDPTQLYFWTKRWQAWERDADVDKRAGRVIGDGTVKGLLAALKR